MARSPTVYVLPPNTVPKVPLEVISSAQWNAAMNDIAQTFNTIQPIQYGGNGVSDNKPLTNSFGLRDSTDLTKLGIFSATDIPTATTLTYKLPSTSGTLALTSQASWEKISLTTISSPLVSVNYADLSSFVMLRLTGFLTPASDNVDLGLRTSIDNGATWDSGASDYNYQITRSTGGTVSARSSTTSAVGFFGGTTAYGNAAGEGVSLELVLDQFNKAQFCFFRGSTFGIVEDGSLNTAQAGGRRSSIVARNAFQVFFTPGSIATGTLLLEGVRG